MAERLPRPGSQEANNLIRGKSERAIYRVLYENRDRPLSMLEIRDHIGGERGSHEQLQRRRRSLNPLFVIEQTREGGQTKYRLTGRKKKLFTGEEGISEKVKAQVLAPQRCAMCGRTPLGDGVRLQVDHKVPREWGGTDEVENLQPLCEEHNRGKKAFFATYDEDADKIRQAINHDQVHKRIGELLKAFGGEWVSTDLIGLVANAVEPQEDYQKRTRELRVLGWDIQVRKRKEGRRFVAYYRAASWETWPSGRIRTEITKRERSRKQ